MKRTSSKHGKSLNKMLKFLILFNVFSIPLYIIMVTGVNYYPLQKVTADLVGASLNALSIPASQDELFISITEPGGSFSGRIIWDCTGWKSMMAFAALVLASMNGRKKTLIGISLLPLVYAANIFRITAVFAIVHFYGAEYFQLIHSIMFSGFMILFILALWVIWLRYFKLSDE